MQYLKTSLSINENDVAANITPPPKPSIIPCTRLVILIGSNIRKAPITVASPAVKLAIGFADTEGVSHQQQGCSSLKKVT